MKNKGRKFAVVVATSVLIVLTLVYTMIGALNGLDVSWVSGFLMTLGSVYPTYIGANTVQKIKKPKGGDSE